MEARLAHFSAPARGYAAPANLRREPTDLRQLVHKTWEQLTGQGRNGAARLIEQGIERGTPPDVEQAVEDGVAPPASSASPASSADAGLPDTRCEADPRAIGQVLRNIL